MANKQHGALTETDGLHEPKGIEASVANKIYVSDGAGSGTWTTIQDIVNPAYICVYLDQTENTSRIFGPEDLDTILPFTLDYLTNVSSNFTYNNITKDITYNGTADISVQIVASVTLSKIGSGDPSLKFYIQKDTGSGFITQTRTMAGETIEDNSLANLAVACVGELSTGDKLRMAVECDTALTVTAENINITISGITV